MDAATRTDLESHLGHELGGVRIHRGDLAARAASELNAAAFTVGRDVVFGSGQYAPQNVRGRKLLAHELTHTIQQGGDRPLDASMYSVLAPGHQSEREAAMVTGGAHGAQSIMPLAAGSPVVQRDTPPGPEAPATAAPPTPADAVVLDAFTFDKADLTQEHIVSLRKVAAMINANLGAYRNVIITGYTDAVGSEQYNQGLGLQRAIKVWGRLLKEGVRPSLMGVSSEGKGQLAVETPLADSRNRRVVITFEATPALTDVAGKEPAPGNPPAKSEPDSPGPKKGADKPPDVTVVDPSPSSLNIEGKRISWLKRGDKWLVSPALQAQYPVDRPTQIGNLSVTLALPDSSLMEIDMRSGRGSPPPTGLHAFSQLDLLHGIGASFQFAPDKFDPVVFQAMIMLANLHVLQVGDDDVLELGLGPGFNVHIRNLDPKGVAPQDPGTHQLEAILPQGQVVFHPGPLVGPAHPTLHKWVKGLVININGSLLLKPGQQPGQGEQVGGQVGVSVGWEFELPLGHHK